jgi:glycosyltransferase involved in cell wall biosynthesis
MKISVVIPCYNSARTIAETLDSILAQTYGDFEVIAVDDGSSDDTAKVIGAYQGRVKYVHQSNAGVSAARNNGVAHAAGKWIAFCDSDDLWVEDKLQIVASAIAGVPTQCDLIFSDYAIMDDGKISEPKGMMSSKTMFPVFREFGLKIADMFDGRAAIRPVRADGRPAEITCYYGHMLKWLILGNVLLPTAVVVRKQAYERVEGFKSEFRNAEDTEFFLRLSKKSRFLYIDEPLIVYRRISTSLLATSMLKTMRNGARAVEINCKDDPEVYGVYKDAVDRSLARKYARLAYFFVTELDPPNAFAAAKTSLGYRLSEGKAWLMLLASMIPRPVLGMIRSAVASRKRRG